GGILSMRYLREQNHEFIAASAAHRIRAAHATPQALCYRLQQPVADAVAESVVDVLEAIQIEEQHRQFLPMAVRYGDRLRQAVIENDSVWNVRETVVLREIGHADRQSPRGAHVVEHHDGPGNASTPVVDGGGGVLDCGFYTVTA